MFISVTDIGTLTDYNLHMLDDKEHVPRHDVRIPTND